MTLEDERLALAQAALELVDRILDFAGVPLSPSPVRKEPLSNAEKCRRRREAKRHQSDTADGVATPKATPSDTGRGVGGTLSLISDFSEKKRESEVFAREPSDTGATPKATPATPETTPLGVAPDGERYVRLTDAITPELTAAAQLATVQDIAAAWAKFTGHHADKWIHVAGQWQVWCVREAKRERVEREKLRAIGIVKAPGAIDYEAQARANARARKQAAERPKEPPLTPEVMAQTLREIGLK
jgi:hypothetical protein